MRNAADIQIDNLEEEIQELKNELDTKQDVIDELEEKIKNYNVCM